MTNETIQHRDPVPAGDPLTTDQRLALTEIVLVELAEILAAPEKAALVDERLTAVRRFIDGRAKAAAEPCRCSVCLYVTERVDPPGDPVPEPTPIDWADAESVAKAEAG